MLIARVAGENFRLFEFFELAAGPAGNWIVGPNASGKTSLLEALFCAARGRSFRTAEHAPLVRAGQAQWRLAVQLQPCDAPARTLHVQGDAATVAPELGGSLSRAELARLLPIQVIDPSLHRLLEEGPAYRRRFLDWGVFHVEHAFHATWQRYTRALKQRNAALGRSLPDRDVNAWNAEMVEAGSALQAHRQTQVGLLQRAFRTREQALFGAERFTLQLYPGWPSEQPLELLLQDHLARDRSRGTTSVGPHRAELRVRADQRSVRHRLSRGQQKLLTAGLVLAQADVVASAIGQSPTLLLDDFGSELDDHFQQLLLGELTSYRGQVFATALSLPANAKGHVFHVEHGRVGAPRVI